MDLNSIASRFDIKGTVTDISPLGDGLINDTYKVTTTDGAYVLQRINNAIFQDVDLLQDNIVKITSHLRRKGVKTLDFINVKGSSRTYMEDEEGKYWRTSAFVEGSVTRDAVTPESSYLCGKAFGEFESQLADLDPSELGETIPDFHNIELRVRQLEDAAAGDRAGRLSDPECMDILQEMRSLSTRMCLSERLYREGKLSKRICHCDTKVNNMLFDEDGNVICIIDLDTTMPSFVFSDYGDFLRTAANEVAEDCPEIERVSFKMDIYEAFTAGYLETAPLTQTEKENLPYAAVLFPYMQAVRFFTDYLNGDTYYKIKYPEHNLVRTRNQMALMHDILKKIF